MGFLVDTTHLVFGISRIVVMLALQVLQFETSYYEEGSKRFGKIELSTFICFSFNLAIFDREECQLLYFSLSLKQLTKKNKPDLKTRKH